MGTQAILDASVLVTQVLVSQGWATQGVVTVSGNYTPLATDAVVLADATAGPITITLADATQAPYVTGQRYTIIKTDSSGNNVTVTGTNGQLVAGQGSIALTSGDAYTGVVFDSAYWQVWAGLTVVAPPAAPVDWINIVTEWGADPTGSADSTAAINGALASAVPGQVVYGRGLFKTTGPILGLAGVELRGSLPATQSGNSASSDWGLVLKPASNWSQGTAPVAGAVVFNGAARPSLRDVWVDGSASPGGVDAIASYGGTSAASLIRCGIYAAAGNGISAVPDSHGNSPDGWRMDTVVIQQAGGNGVTGRFPDATMSNVHAQSCTLDGFSLTAGGNWTMLGCRADLNTNGFTLDCFPSGNFGDSVIMIGCRTQRNARNGLNVINSSAAGTDKRLPVIAVGCSFDGDGANGGSGGGGYAGIAVTGNNKVHLTATNVVVLTTDVPGGCPQYGIATATAGSAPGAPTTVAYASGMLNYVTAAVNNAAPAANFIIAPGVTAAAGYNPSGGTPLSSGTVTLAAGTATVSSPLVTSGAVIMLTCQVPAGTPGFLRVSARSAGTSFTITSSSGSDTSTVGWVILGP